MKKIILQNFFTEISKETKHISPVNLEINEKEITVILGRSGEGKSTFLYALADLIPWNGTNNIFSKPAIVFQNNTIFPWMTVEQNISFGIKKNNYEKEKIINHLLKKIELTEKRKSYPYQLSGGEKQRVAIAQSFASDSEIILMDEPFSSLDYQTRKNLQEWLSDFVKNKKTIIFVTHNIEEAIILGDRILIMEKHCFIKDIRNKIKQKKNHLSSPEFIEFKKEIIENIKK